MKTFGLLFFCMLISQFAYSDEMFKYKYLRLANGGCVKCVFATRTLNKISDEYKPIVIFKQNEKSTYESDLIANGLQWPSDKIVFSDSLSQLFPSDTFGKLYVTNDHVKYQSISLNFDFDVAWLNIIYMNLNKSSFDIPENIKLGKYMAYYPYLDNKLIHNEQTKTVYHVQGETTYSYRLDGDLKYNLFKRYLIDSGQINEYFKGAKLLADNKIDMSEFGSLTYNKDTLIALVNISFIKFTSKANRVERHQFIAKFHKGTLVDSRMLYESGEHVTYDEYGMNCISYRNDSIFIRSNRYNKKDLLMKGDHITLFLPKKNHYYPVKTYNLEIPDHLLSKSTGMNDYTAGSFYHAGNTVDYFYYRSPHVFNSNKNINLSDKLLRNDKDSIIQVSAMNYHGFNAIILNRYDNQNLHYLYFIMGDQYLTSEISLTHNDNPIKFSSRGISAIDISERKMLNITFSVPKIIK